MGDDNNVGVGDNVEFGEGGGGVVAFGMAVEVLSLSLLVLVMVVSDCGGSSFRILKLAVLAVSAVLMSLLSVLVRAAAEAMKSQLQRYRKVWQ